MMYHQTTQVPNVLFDLHLPNLTEAELKMLLIIIRQTNGWVNKRTGCRKTRDRISHGQFIQKTGLSRRVISKTLKSLIEKGLITVTCQYGNVLHRAEDRKGMVRMFYAFQTEPKKVAPVPLRTYTMKHIGEVLRLSGYQKVLFPRL